MDRELFDEYIAGFNAEDTTAFDRFIASDRMNRWRGRRAENLLTLFTGPGTDTVDWHSTKRCTRTWSPVNWAGSGTEVGAHAWHQAFAAGENCRVENSRSIQRDEDQVDMEPRDDASSRPGAVSAAQYCGFVQLRYAYRLEPTAAQRAGLARAFGCARVVFNDGLRARQEAYAAGTPYIKDAALQTRVITVAKRTPERAWLAEVSSVVLVQALADLHAAYRNLFASVSGAREGRRVGPPRFRSRKDTRQSIRLTRNGFSVRPNGRLYVAKIGEIAVRWSRPLPAAPSSVTVTLDPSGRYQVSFVVLVADKPLPVVEPEVGVDLGLTHFAVLSDGTKIASPRFLRRAERRLRKAQQNLSRKEKGGSNRVKARRRVAKQHAEVADARRDFHHKLSTHLVRDNQAVYVEDLAVAGLARTRLAKSVHDAGWSAFVRMLEYKAARHHRGFARIGRFEPTSQVCSACGAKDGPKPLAVREWACQGCGAVHDRDVNAAKNVLALGRRESLNACGGDVSPPGAVAVADEAGTHRGAA